MSKILLGIIAAMGIGGYFYYQTAIIPMKNKIEEQTAVILAQDLRDQEQKAAIAAIQENLETTTKALAGLQLRNQRAEEQMSEYLDIIRRHNLAKIASPRPGSIQLKAIRATKEVFDAIEDVRKSISNPDIN